MSARFKYDYLYDGSVLTHTKDPAFLKVIPFIMQNEGGYVNDPNDAGGETNFGISKARYPELNIATLTEAQAKELYYRDYYLKFGLDKVQDIAKKTTLLDFLVNSGKAPFIIQETLNKYFNNSLAIDGKIGPLTLDSINKAPKIEFIEKLNIERLNYLKTLSSWEFFGNGWTKRVSKNLNLIDGGTITGIGIGIALLIGFFILKTK